jgi:hypothetical protein
VSTLKCESCGHWINPRKRLLYPNTDNEAVGWVICANGSVIKRVSTACTHHTKLTEDAPAAEPQQKRRLIK